MFYPMYPVRDNNFMGYSYHMLLQPWLYNLAINNSNIQPTSTISGPIYLDIMAISNGISNTIIHGLTGYNHNNNNKNGI
jgi:hypothetical protein